MRVSGPHVVLGTSDGHVLHYSAGQGPPQFIRKRLVSPTRRSIDDILLLPEHGKVLVLTGSWPNRSRQTGNVI